MIYAEKNEVATHNQISRLSQCRSREVLPIQVLINAQNLAQMRIAAADDNLQHSRFAALASADAFGQNVDIAVYVFGEVVLHFLPALFQHHEHCGPELVHFKLLLHAARQTVAVPFVFEGVFDRADIGVGAAHQTLDQEFATRGAGLVPEVRPVAFALPAAE